jgi:large subunit ribosomal protein L14
MIQQGSILNVIDNSGAKKLMCIKILNAGYKQRYAKIGDTILVSVKSIRFSKNIKIKKGDLCKAVIVKTKKGAFSFSSNYKSFVENAAVLLNKQNKLLGTRIFGTIPKQFKYSRYLKLTTLSSGLSI